MTRNLQIDTARVFNPLLEPARYKGAFGGRGSGKSHFFAGLMVEDCLREPSISGEGLRCVCIREVQKDLTQSAKLLIEDKLAAYRLGEADGFKVYRDSIQTPKDGIIIFKGLQDYTAESIKSLEKFKRAWWEEAQTGTAHSMALLRPTIREEGSEIWASWNPRRKADPIDKLFRGDELPTGAAVVRANWSDNPWFPGVLEQERLDCLRLQPDQYDHVWDGGYVTIIEGAYFAKELAKAKEERRICKVSFDPLFRVKIFCDLGGTGAKADAFTMWPAQFVDREIRVRDYYEAQGQSIGYHVDWLHSKGYGPNRADIYLPHDGKTMDRTHDMSFESEFRRAGYDVTTIPNQGAGAARMRIESARRRFPSVQFDEVTTEAGRGALGWYHEKRTVDGRDVGLGPEHDWSSHAADAFGMMCVAYEAPNKRLDDWKFKPRKVA